MMDGEKMSWAERFGQIEEFGWLAWLDQGILVLCLAWLVWMALLVWKYRPEIGVRGWRSLLHDLWILIGLFGLPGYLFGMLLDIWWF